MPRSVLSVNTVPLASVVASQTNGRFSGNPRRRGWYGARAPANLRRFVADIEIVGDMCAAMEDGRPTANNELHTGVAKMLNGQFKVHAWIFWLCLARTPRFAPRRACVGHAQRC